MILWVTEPMSGPRGARLQGHHTWAVLTKGAWAERRSDTAVSPWRTLSAALLSPTRARGRTGILPFNWANLTPSRSCVLVARPLDISKTFSSKFTGKTIPCQELVMSRLITVLGSNPSDSSGKDLKIWHQVNNKVCHVDDGLSWIPAEAFPKQSAFVWFSMQEKVSSFQKRVLSSLRGAASKTSELRMGQQHFALEQVMGTVINLCLGNSSLPFWNGASWLLACLEMLGFFVCFCFSCVPFHHLDVNNTTWLPLWMLQWVSERGRWPYREMHGWMSGREIAGILLARTCAAVKKSNYRMTFTSLLHYNPDSVLRMMPLEWCPKW